MHLPPSRVVVHALYVLQEMKDAAYAITRGDKIHRILSLLVMIGILGSELSDGRMSFWYRFAAAPVFATALIWYSDTFGASLPWRTAPRDVRVFGWIALILMGVTHTLIQILP